jgi:hypothetical protein
MASLGSTFDHHQGRIIVADFLGLAPLPDPIYKLVVGFYPLTFLPRLFSLLDLPQKPLCQSVSRQDDYVALMPTSP